MAIHHAAHAYGNLKKLNAELTEEELLSDVSALNAETEEELCSATAAKPAKAEVQRKNRAEKPHTAKSRECSAVLKRTKKEQ